MIPKRTPHHTTVILECHGVAPNFTYSVVARNVVSLEGAQKLAKEFAAGKPGTVYVPCRFWPGVLAQVKMVVKPVAPDNGELVQKQASVAASGR